jgi:DNA polymerase-3 subunit beta
MKLRAKREALLKPLMQVGSVVERRQTLPILSNILFHAKGSKLSITATDLEVELRSSAEIETDEEKDFTLPARKLIDICKALPEDSKIEINLDGDRATLRSGKSRFTLSVLPAQDFPSIESSTSWDRISLPEKVFKRLLDKTQFAMAQQDVRYYLNGLFLEIKEGRIRTVATDGHRLAISEAPYKLESGSDVEVILPRKAVIELGRLLSDSDDTVEIEISSNHVRVNLKEASFTTKLIDGRYPDYRGVLPLNTDKKVVADRELLKQALQRTSILSNEKYRGIRFKLSSGVLELLAHNPEQEEAEEEIEVGYEGDELVIGFNVGYLIDVLSVINGESVQLALSDPNSSCLIHAEGSDESRYVVMPMRL